ncbi:hypothetical protein [Mycobacterium sp. 236(2023)]|uniref:Rv1733c family protein n=1 Tax=Mycobacterium sp. 236(2023) TaxID=3038163 RepID=UPI0024152A6F|nr:hypothetical protein [Mycobacterium sp. 236(2023)]MDG4669372.1 hypothetical protein [Mycobacterium sp. 236(2023)]
MSVRAGRWWRHIASNPLVRGTDRLEVLLTAVGVAAALVATVFALGVGQSSYATQLQIVRADAYDRHAVQAQVVDGSHGVAADSDAPQKVRVEWLDGAQQRFAEVMSPGTVTRGAAMTVWLDDAGSVVDRPRTAQDAKLFAAGTAFVVWLVSMAFVALLIVLGRRLLNICRMRAWERELLLFAHNDDGWANRHS